MSYGGDFAAQSIGERVGDNGREESCARNGKWIICLAAIVASYEVMVVRGAFGVQAPARPVILLCSFLVLLATAFAPVMLFLVLPGRL
jgi:hypothetical protein